MIWFFWAVSTLTSSHGLLWNLQRHCLWYNITAVIWFLVHSRSHHYLFNGTSQDGIHVKIKAINPLNIFFSLLFFTLFLAAFLFQLWCRFFFSTLLFILCTLIWMSFLNLKTDEQGMLINLFSIICIIFFRVSDGAGAFPISHWARMGYMDGHRWRYNLFYGSHSQLRSSYHWGQASDLNTAKQKHKLYFHYMSSRINISKMITSTVKINTLITLVNLKN